MLCHGPSNTADLSRDCQGSGFVTRNADGATSAARHRALISLCRLVWPCRNEAVPILLPPWDHHPMWDVLCSVRALISAFSALCLPGKQELEALYRFTAGNGYNRTSSPAETRFGRNFILRSYLRINFHCFFVVVEQKLLARRSEIDVHLEAGVLRDFPAVWTAAK